MSLAVCPSSFFDPSETLRDRNDRHPSPSTTPAIEKSFPHLLDVVVAQRTAVLELLSGKDQTLLVWRDALLVLDLALDIVDGVAGLDLKRDGLAREGLDEARKARC